MVITSAGAAVAGDVTAVNAETTARTEAPRLRRAREQNSAPRRPPRGPRRQQCPRFRNSLFRLLLLRRYANPRASRCLGKNRRLRNINPLRRSRKCRRPSSPRVRPTRPRSNARCRKADSNWFRLARETPSSPLRSRNSSQPSGNAAHPRPIWRSRSSRSKPAARKIRLRRTECWRD